MTIFSKRLFGGESELSRYVHSSQKILSAHVACLLSCAVVYLLLKLTLLGSPLLFIDEGETLYNALIILQGKLPYRDSLSHHFLGYVLPFVEIAKIVGFSPVLIFLGALAHQVLGAYGLFLLTARFWSYPVALAASLLLITAREPWAVGYTPLHQLIPFITWSWFLCVIALQKRSVAALSAAFILCGVAFSFDQRALFLSVTPLFVLTTLAFDGVALVSLFLSICSWLFFPLSAVLTLSLTGILPLWFEQTIHYPFQFRGLSGEGKNYFTTLLAVYAPLVEQTPLLLLYAALGALSFVRLKTNSFMDRWTRVALLGAFIISIMPFGLFAGRNFDYYTAPWLPLLAFLAPFSASFFSMRLRPVIYGLLWIPVVIALAQAIALFGSQDHAYAKERTVITVSRFLREIDPQSTRKILLWGYRPDLLVFAERTSYLPFVNRQMIHPDAQVTDREDRAARVYPLYEQRFLAALEETPPDIIIMYYAPVDLPSKSDDAVKALVKSEYELLQEFRESGREDDGGGVFGVYQRRESEETVVGSS